MIIVKESLDIFQKRQLDIAKKTLRMPDAAVGIMGGMTKDEAREFLLSIGYTQDKINRMEESKQLKQNYILKDDIRIGDNILESGDRIVIIKKTEKVELSSKVVEKIIEYIYARHYSDIRTAKAAKTWLQKKLQRKFSSTLLKFGDPDAGNYEVVYNKWMDYAEKLSTKKEATSYSPQRVIQKGIHGSSTHLEAILRDFFRPFGLSVKWTVDSIEIVMPDPDWYWNEFSASGDLREFNKIIAQFNVDYDIVDDTIVVFI